MREHAVTAYAALQSRNQARFLSRLAFDLTVWARDAYELLTNDADASADLLTGHNELQHKVTGHLKHLLEENQLRYPDDVFINIFLDMAPKAKCEGKLHEIFESLYESYLRGRPRAPDN